MIKKYCIVKSFFSIIVLFSFFSAGVSCSNDKKDAPDRMLKMSTEYEELLRFNNEQHMKNLSLAICQDVIQEIFIGHRKDVDHIGLKIGHFMDVSDIVAIKAELNEGKGYEPYIAYWNDKGRVLRTEKDALIPDSFMAGRSKQSSEVSLKGKDEVTVKVTVYFSNDKMENFMTDIRKRYFGSEEIDKK